MEIDHYKIEKFIQGELKGEELIEFEALIEKDEALQKKVNFYKYAVSVLSEKQETTQADEDKLAKINPILSQLRDKYFIDKTKTIETEISKKETKSKPALIKRLLPFAALTAAAAVLLIFFFLPQMKNQANPEIAALNFKPYPLNTNPMGGENTVKLFEDAQRNYNSGRFEQANKQLTDFLNEIPDAPEVWLAKGCTAFALNDVNTALASFAKVIEIDDSGISHPYANWYLALCYLKKDDPTKGINHLEKIKEGEDNYKDAKRLLRKLK